MTLYDEQKEVGDIGEDIFRSILVKRKLVIIKEPDPNEYFPYFDFIFIKNRQNIAVEVKTETKDSNYVSIETFQNGKESAFNLTTANYYFIYNIPDATGYLAEVKDIREYIEQHQLREMPCAGNNMHYLVPKSIFIRYYTHKPAE